MKINFNETMITNMDIEKTGNTLFKIAITMLDGRTIVAENVNLNVFNIEYEEEEYHEYRNEWDYLFVFLLLFLANIPLQQ